MLHKLILMLVGRLANRMLQTIVSHEVVQINELSQPTSDYTKVELVVVCSETKTELTTDVSKIQDPNLLASVSGPHLCETTEKTVTTSQINETNNIKDE